MTRSTQGAPFFSIPPSGLGQDLCILAGECSGDLIGARILTALRKEKPSLRVWGVGGPLMEKAGDFSSLFPFQDLSHIGVGSILKNLPMLLRRKRQMIHEITQRRPSGLLTIDCPEFSLRVSRAVPFIKRVHCVAPSVWAWRPKRAFKLAQQTDHLLCLFPFEKAYFTHMDCDYVGHPLADEDVGNAEHFWVNHPYLDPRHPLLCLMPGSRPQEIYKFWPIFLKTTQQLKHQIPNLQCVVITLPHLKSFFLEHKCPYEIVEDESLKKHAIKAATAALVCSGTATLEVAFQETPMVIAYKIHPLGAWVLRRLLRVSSIGLINLVAEHPFVPECLQADFTPDTLSQHLYPLLTDEGQRSFQKNNLNQATMHLKGESSFGKTAAHAIMRALNL